MARDYLTEAFGELTPQQEEFCAAKTRFVGFGGSKGGGKSHIVRYKATVLAMKYAGIKILVIRRKNRDLKRNYIRPLMSALAVLPESERPKYNVQDMLMTYANGSTIEYGFCDSDADADGYRGAEWDVLILDEATELSEYQIKTLATVVRGVNSFPKRIYITFNPGGVGHAEIKRIFIDRDYRRSERAKDYTFIPSRIWHNIPLLMSDHGFVTAWDEYRLKNKGAKLDEETARKLVYSSDYVRGLDSLPEVLREAYINGNMDIFSGQFFSEFNEEVHVVSEAEIVAALRREGYEGEGLPRGWRRSAAMDHGLDRLAILWFATDEKGRVYCYRNYEESNVIISSAARRFRELSRYPDGEPETIEQVIAPPDFWGRERVNAKSRADIFYEEGIPLVKASNSREDGWANVKEYLKYEAHKRGNEMAVIKAPRLVFLDSCGWIIKFLPLLQSDPKKPSDTMKEPHQITHSPDALRYWCSVRQPGVYAAPIPQRYNFDSERPKTGGWGEVSERYLTGGY